MTIAAKAPVSINVGDRDRSETDGKRWLALTFALCAVLIAADIWWLVADRGSFPLDIDEAGYMTIALSDHSALVHGGLGSYWHTIEAQYPFAPLVPALTALVYVLRTSILASFAVDLASLVVLGGASYGIAKRLVGPKLGALAAVVTVTVPGSINYSREYLFALPSVALMTCAVYSLIRSDGLQHRRWAVTLGAALGLMFLARTMTVALAPAVLLAGAVRVAMLERDRPRAAANLLLAAGLAVLIASIWYAPNLNPVFKYLTSYGYGAHAAAYGGATSIVSWNWWTRELHKMFSEDLFVPLGVIASAGVLAAAVIGAWGVWTARNRGRALLRLARSDALTVAIVLAGGYVALSSSSNQGAGFALMLVPSLIAIAILPLRRAGRVRTLAVVALGALATLNVIVSMDLIQWLSTPRGVVVPGLGPAPLLNGQGYSLGALRAEIPGNLTHFEPREHAWPRADQLAAQFVLTFAEAHGRLPIVAFGMRNRVFNTNTVRLAARLYYDEAIPVAQLDPAFGGDTAVAYASYLADPRYGQPNFLLTTSTVAGDFTPVVTPKQVAEAARSDGFTPVKAMTLPDGRVLTFWWLDRGPRTSRPSR